MKALKLFALLIGLICCISSCGDDSTSGSDDELVRITLTNPNADTIKNYGLDLDLIPVDSNLELMANDQALLFQLEDRNVNGLPDKLFTFLDLLPNSTHIIVGQAATEAAAKPVKRVQALLMDAQSGKHLTTYVYQESNQLRHQGIVMENDLIAYRALMQTSFAFDIIGKRFKELVIDTKPDISQEDKWGGDILNEANSLGIGAPALYNLDGIVRLDKFDSREVQVLANGPLRAEIQTVVKGVPVRDEKVDVQINMEMQAGNQWIEVDLQILSSTDLTLQFAFGLPKHDDATDFTQGLESAVHFAYTHGLQSAQGEQLGMALLVPEIYELDHYREDPFDYYYLATPIDKKVTYRLLAAWVKGQRTIFDEVDFLNFVRDQAKTLGRKPAVKVEWNQG